MVVLGGVAVSYERGTPVPPATCPVKQCISELVISVSLISCFPLASDDAVKGHISLHTLVSIQTSLSLLVAEVLVGLATDTTVYLSRQGEALKVNKWTFTIRDSNSPWHPGLPGRPPPLYVELSTREYSGRVA